MYTIYITHNKVLLKLVIQSGIKVSKFYKTTNLNCSLYSVYFVLQVKTKDGGWQYARHANATYHSNKQRLDFFRRRKWRRKLNCITPGQAAVFYILRDRDKRKRDRQVCCSSSFSIINLEI